MNIVSKIRSAKSKAVGGKKDRCQKGKSCSATCISSWKLCLVEMPDSVSKGVGKLKDNIGRLKIRTKVLARKVAQNITEKGRKETLERKRINYISSLDKLDERMRDAATRGKVWEESKGDRRRRKEDRFYELKDKVSDKVNKAAYSGNREEYDRWMGRLRKLEEYGQDKLGDRNSPTSNKETLWFQNRLKKEFEGEGVEISVKGRNKYKDMALTKLVAGNKVEILLEENGTSFSFRVNGEYKAKETIPKAERLAIARFVKESFPRIVKNMKEGTEVEVIAYWGDDRKEARIKAYRSFGFELRDADSTVMYGAIKSGKIVPSNARNNTDYNRNISPDNFNFSSITGSVRCKIGKPCGKVCIHRNYECLVDGSEETSQSLAKLRDRVQIEKRGGGQSLEGENLNWDKLSGRVKEWLKANGLESGDGGFGHDEAHVLVKDYLGKTSKQIAGLLGGTGSGPSVVEEIFVDFAERLSKSKDRGSFIQSGGIRKIIEDSIELSRSLGYIPSDSPLAKNKERSIRSLERVLGAIAKREDFDRFLTTVKTARKLSTKEWEDDNEAIPR